MSTQEITIGNHKIAVLTRHQPSSCFSIISESRSHGIGQTVGVQEEGRIEALVGYLDLLYGKVND